MNLPIKFPSDTEVILEEVARVPGTHTREATPIDPGHPERRCSDPAEVAQGGLAQTVFRGTGTPRPTYHPGVHRTSCTLTATPCRTNWSCR